MRRRGGNTVGVDCRRTADRQTVQSSGEAFVQRSKTTGNRHQQQQSGLRVGQLLRRNSVPLPLPRRFTKVVSDGAFTPQKTRSVNSGVILMPRQHGARIAIAGP